MEQTRSESVKKFVKKKHESAVRERLPTPRKKRCEGRVKQTKPPSPRRRKIKEQLVRPRRNDGCDPRDAGAVRQVGGDFYFHSPAHVVSRFPTRSSFAHRLSVFVRLLYALIDDTPLRRCSVKQKNHSFRLEQKSYSSPK